MSAAALSGLEPIAAAVRGGEPIATTAADERVQQLRALLAQVEQGPTLPTLPTFASALDAAQGGGVGSAYPSSAPLAGGALSADAYTSPASTSGAAYAMPADGYPTATPTVDSYLTAASTVDGYPAATPTVDGYPSATPTTVAYDSATPAAGDSAGGGSTYAPLIEQAAARYGIDPSLLYGLIEQESGFDPSASSSAGAQGLTQLMPSTAASLGVTEPLNPTQSIEGGARYLSQLLHQFAGNTTDALAAYNAGPGAVEQYGGVPPYPETQQYVAKVLGYAASFSPSGQGVGIAALPSATTLPSDTAAPTVTVLPSDTTATTAPIATAAITAPTTPSEAIV
ncbi:MAG TPA: lytic transglycosylase domain-containing protein [Solirubrobacteraceae bacterium]|jgi:soluble lytic murein transglycosylase-like protein|nr:lytic transglycosylase domain-containing protein [Solirubrobacteraceae bacterium]